MGTVADRDRIGPGGTVIVRHGLYDFGGNVSTLSAVELEEGPCDVHVAPRPRRDPLFVIEEGVSVFVVDHHRVAPRGSAIAGRGHRDTARGAIREAEIVYQRGIVERAVGSKSKDR